jgi:hypothetical protein
MTGQQARQKKNASPRKSFPVIIVDFVDSSKMELFVPKKEEENEKKKYLCFADLSYDTIYDECKCPGR